MEDVPKREIIFRNDDVLLANPVTGAMKNCLRHNTFFGHFKEADKIFKKYNVPQVLAILSEGIPLYPEWIQFIKERQHRYTIQMHGYDHRWYTAFSEEEAYQILKKAKEDIEDAFGVTVTRWYVPFGRMWFPEWSLRVCERLGVQFHTRGTAPARTYHFHYWNSRDRRNIGRLVEHYYGKPHEETN
jgi:peptidoglycan/xylan/chitin deacetylase (PgdA/CDA1 family)